MAYIVDPDKMPRSVASDLGQHWLFKVAQELIQADQHQAPNTKGKNRQIQLSSHKMNRSQEIVTLSQKSYPNLNEYIFNSHNYSHYKKDIRKWNTI